MGTKRQCYLHIYSRFRESERFLSDGDTWTVKSFRVRSTKTQYCMDVLLQFDSVKNRKNFVKQYCIGRRNGKATELTEKLFGRYEDVPVYSIDIPYTLFEAINDEEHCPITIDSMHDDEETIAAKWAEIKKWYSEHPRQNQLASVLLTKKGILAQ